MTKKILLGLGATTALVGTSFAIVSCANDSTPEKTEATIMYQETAFGTSKTDIVDIDDYVTKYSSTTISDGDKATLDAIFTSNPEGAIDSITVAKADADIVKFTLTPADGFTLDKDTFDIVYSSGDDNSTPADGFTLDKDTFDIVYDTGLETGSEA